MCHVWLLTSTLTSNTQVNIAKAGAIDPIVDLLIRGSEECQTGAAEALNNTILTLTDKKGNPLAWSSLENMGL